MIEEIVRKEFVEQGPISSALPYAQACWNNRRQRGFTHMVHLEA
jgi:hypothetical protein